MRIGELAATVGVTTRAIRHYHHLGLLPEPERLGNGYREYGLRHAVELARIRRLTELGLGLGEVRDVLAEDAGRDLVEVLAELDADLARQEAAIHGRRARLRELLAEAEQGRLPAEGPVSPELAALFGELGDLGRTSPTAAKDREMLTLIDTSTPPELRGQLMATLLPTMTGPGALDAARDVYARLDALADAAPDDPRVAEAAQAVMAWLPPELPTAEVEENNALLDAILGDFSPAQAEVVRLALRMASEGGAR
ncbi:MerR family transcriptional regulator [Streptomyces kunmingensis]|uniref:MerR family transcriptional regulator n=1 Tax=Streptomyces kunmingensis TaxID=68225 RepID=A0ABU6C652_9ACTN|nr:MerR family transcriptional regulator [Streptomyces kunmingensis]MEB3959691.1 MerR family transcriptional regulator [Streptomyces kunmingensis]